MTKEEIEKESEEMHPYVVEYNDEGINQAREEYMITAIKFYNLALDEVAKEFDNPGFGWLAKDVQKESILKLKIK